ncbi:MAG TPA: EamA family transporter [Candidatus Sulfotelmatobacter sp.]|nr:EamA family transporter [Candidatus Sulfotelmatobacter sp.]
MRWILVAIIAMSNTTGDLLNTAGMKRIGPVEDLSPRSFLQLTAAIVRSPMVLGGVAALAVGFFAVMSLLSITTVSFAIPATAIGYLVETLLAKYILKEDVRWRRWAAAGLVVIGVVLLRF